MNHGNFFRNNVSTLCRDSTKCPKPTKDASSLGEEWTAAGSSQRTHFVSSGATAAQPIIIYKGCLEAHHPWAHWYIIMSICLKRCTVYVDIPSQIFWKYQKLTSSMSEVRFLIPKFPPFRFIPCLSLLSYNIPRLHASNISTVLSSATFKKSN